MFQYRVGILNPPLLTRNEIVCKISELKIIKEIIKNRINDYYNDINVLNESVSDEF